jgi:SAM-dependent methyltransferase
MSTEPWPEVAASDFWEERYAGSDRVWSGAANRALVDVVSAWQPGRALDLGCGEGADVIWLAQQGWQATGIDISPTAIARARAAASARGLTSTQARFEAIDLSTWRDSEQYDLVTASFLHSPAALSRTEILRALADRVVSGGHLLVIAHAAPPPWSRHRDGHHHHADFPSPEGEVASLALDSAAWATVLAEVRTRDAVAPDGQPTELEDSVVVLRRA